MRFVYDVAVYHSYLAAAGQPVHPNLNVGHLWSCYCLTEASIVYMGGT